MNADETWPPPATREPRAFYTVARNPKRPASTNGARPLALVLVLSLLRLAAATVPVLLALWIFELVR